MNNQISSQEGYVSVSGGRVWYRIVGDGDAAPLLALHGGPGVPHDYLEPLAALADERPVIFYDQLGCGRSDRPNDVSLWRIERFVEELGQVRRALGLERVHLFGHSWGGWLATEYLRTKPAGVVSLVMASSCFSVAQYLAEVTRLVENLPGDVRTVLRQHEQAGTTDSAAYQQAVEEFNRRHLCRMQPYPEAMQRAGAGIGVAVYQTMQGPNEFTFTGNLVGWDRAEWVHEITLPSLFTCGRYDEVTPLCVQQSQRLVAGAELVVFEQSAHMAHLEEPERYLQVLRDFLAHAENRFIAQHIIDGGSQ
jgi:proline iminopeptidase